MSPRPLSADEEFEALKEILREIQNDHERLARQDPVDIPEHERHRARLRALIEAIQDWRTKHV
jgi:hypothetical protein